MSPNLIGLAMVKLLMKYTNDAPAEVHILFSFYKKFSSSFPFTQPFPGIYFFWGKYLNFQVWGVCLCDSLFWWSCLCHFLTVQFPDIVDRWNHGMRSFCSDLALEIAICRILTSFWLSGIVVYLAFVFRVLFCAGIH